MAIQLNERDHLIFNLINEHQVLLEKHISWFIADENKPVLIRDRLRKLFYLDYLLCHRHGTKLPWWTTPTKPLVYLLSDMAKNVTGIEQDEVDRFDAEWQRHHLEVANLRMLYLISQKNEKISNFEWQTVKEEEKAKTGLDAKVSFVCNGIAYDIGIINNPQLDKESISRIEGSLKDNGCEMVLMIARDDETKVALQDAINGSTDSALAKYCFFSTHQKLYKKGMVASKWENSEKRDLNLFPKQEEDKSSQTFAAGKVAQPQQLSA